MILKNKIFLVEWKRGAWKTMLSSIWWSFPDYGQVYANYQLNYNHKKVINYTDVFEFYGKLNKDKFKKKELLLFDEWWMNANSRAFHNKKNKIIWFLAQISRKFNLDVLFIVQDFFDIDVMIRRQIDYKLYVTNLLPYALSVDVYNTTRWQENNLISTYTVDALTALNQFNIDYDTQDLSGFDDKIKEFIK